MKETEQTLFLKSNLLHIRTNEGVFEVINPEEFEAAWIPLGVTIEQYFKSFEGTDHPEWPGSVELIETCKWRGNRDACANEVCWDLKQCQGNPTIKLARLLPKEEFKPAQPTPNFPKGGTTFTESAYKEVEGKGKLIGHIIDDFKNGKEIFVPAVESSEPQENRTIEDVKNSVARNAGLKDWDEVYKRILPSQIDPLVNQAIRWSIEEQEELWKEARHYIDVWRIEELFKRFTIRRNGDKD